MLETGRRDSNILFSILTDSIYSIIRCLMKLPQELRWDIYDLLADAPFRVKRYWLSSEGLAFGPSIDLVSSTRFPWPSSTNIVPIAMNSTAGGGGGAMNGAGQILRRLLLNRQTAQLQDLQKDLQTKVRNFLGIMGFLIVLEVLMQNQNVAAEPLHEDYASFLGPRLVLELKCYDPAEGECPASGFILKPTMVIPEVYCALVILLT